MDQKTYQQDPPTQPHRNLAHEIREELCVSNLCLTEQDLAAETQEQSELCATRLITTFR